MSRTPLIAAALAALMLSLTGCVAIGGSSNVKQPTLGQELLDLKASLDAHAIDQAEYDRAKDAILRRSR